MSGRSYHLCKPDAVAYHNYLYVIGGFNGLSRMNSGEKFDPTTSLWSPVVDMHNPRSNFAIEILDDTIFVTGGFNGVTTTAQTECYNDRTDEWCEPIKSIYWIDTNLKVLLKNPRNWLLPPNLLLQTVDPNSVSIPIHKEINIYISDQMKFGSVLLLND